MKRKNAFFLFFCTIGISWCDESPSLDPAFFQWCQEVRKIGDQPYDSIINLGGTCEVAYQMRLHGIRNESLPFDWIITPFDSLIHILENNFDKFLEKENLVFIHADTQKHILDTKYNIKLLHDFKLQEDFLKDYDTIKTTYNRRIQRLVTLMQSSRKSLFIRKKITKNEAVQLKELLQKLCPENNFTLLVVDGISEMKQSWHINSIINFYLPRPAPDIWKGDPEIWKEIFTHVGLKLLAYDVVV